MNRFNVEVVASDPGQAVRALEEAGLSPSVEFRESPGDWTQTVRTTDVVCVLVEAEDPQAAADFVWRVVGEQARVSADWA